MLGQEYYERSETQTSAGLRDWRGAVIPDNSLESHQPPLQ